MSSSKKGEQIHLLNREIYWTIHTIFWTNSNCQQLSMSQIVQKP